MESVQGSDHRHDGPRDADGNCIECLETPLPTVEAKGGNGGNVPKTLGDTAGEIALGLLGKIIHEMWRDGYIDVDVEHAHLVLDGWVTKLTPDEAALMKTLDDRISQEFQ